MVGLGCGRPCRVGPLSIWPSLSKAHHPNQTGRSDHCSRSSEVNRRHAGVQPYQDSAARNFGGFEAEPDKQLFPWQFSSSENLLGRVKP